MPISFGFVTPAEEGIRIYVNNVEYTNNAISYSFKQVDNEFSDFSATLLGVTEAQRDADIQSKKVIRFESNNKLVFKGILERPDYKTGQEITIKGYGAGESILKRLFIAKTASASSDSSDQRVTYENVSVRTILQEQLSGTGIILDAIDDGSGLGFGTFRGENITKMAFIAEMISQAGGKWWFTYGVKSPYNDNILHVAPSRGSDVPVETFNIAGPEQNADITTNEPDYESLYNSLSYLGYGDGENQIKSIIYHATLNRSPLVTRVDENDTVLQVEDASSFTTSGNIWVGMEKCSYVKGGVDGFEDGDYNNNPTWDVIGGSPSVQTTTVKNGSYALKVLLNGGSNGGVRTSLPDFTNTTYYEGWVRWDVQTDVFSTAIYLEKAGVSNYLGIRRYGANWEYFNGSWNTFGTINTAPTIDTWFKFKMIRNGANWDLYIYNSDGSIAAQQLGISGNGADPDKIHLDTGRSAGTINSYFDDVTYGSLGSITVTRQVTGSYAGPFQTSGTTFYPVSGVSGYPHDSGILVWDAQYTKTSPQTGSSIQVNDLKEGSFQDKRVIDQNVLDLTAQDFLDNHRNLVRRIEVVPSNPYLPLRNLDIGDTITINDDDSDLHDNFRIASKIFDSSEGSERTTLQCGNKKLMLTTEAEEAKKVADVESRFMQGAVNIFTLNETENAESGSAGAVDLFFEIPEDAIAINSIKLAYRNEAPRTWSKFTIISNPNANGDATSCGSASWTTLLDINTESVSAAGLWIAWHGYSTILVPPLYYRVYNVTDGEYYPVSTITFTIDSVSVGGSLWYMPIFLFVPKNLSGKRWQFQLYNNSGAAETINWRIERYYVASDYDINTLTYSTSDISVYTSNDASGTPSWTDRTSAIEAVYGTLAAGNEGSETGLELKDYFTGTGWKGIRLQTDGNSRHKINVTVKCYVKSK